VVISNYEKVKNHLNLKTNCYEHTKSKSAKKPSEPKPKPKPTTEGAKQTTEPTPS